MDSGSRKRGRAGIVAVSRAEPATRYPPVSVLSNLLAARLEMAISQGSHILFAVAGIALPLVMAVAEAPWPRTGDPVYCHAGGRRDGGAAPAAERPLRRAGGGPHAAGEARVGGGTAPHRAQGPA